MRHNRRACAATPAIIALTLSAACASRIPGKSCQVVPIPEAWRIPTETPGNQWFRVGGYDDFEIRKINQKFAIGLKSGTDGGNVYAGQKFSFSLGPHIVLQPLSEEDWNSASQVLHPLEQPYVETCLEGNGDCEHYFRPLKYAGHAFQATGQHPTAIQEAALPSPDGNWLALQSYDGSLEKATAYLPRGGKFYVDVFNLHSGEKRFTAVAHINPGGTWGSVVAPATGTMWMNGGYLFLDIFEDRRKFVICDATK